MKHLSLNAVKLLVKVGAEPPRLRFATAADVARCPPRNCTERTTPYASRVRVTVHAGGQGVNRPQQLQGAGVRPQVAYDTPHAIRHSYSP